MPLRKEFLYCLVVKDLSKGKETERCASDLNNTEHQNEIV